VRTGVATPSGNATVSCMNGTGISDNKSFIDKVELSCQAANAPWKQEMTWIIQGRARWLLEVINSLLLVSEQEITD
jgi:hypothetical protein